MKICLLGGTGFIGSHLATAFRDEGVTVRVFGLAPPLYPALEGVEYVAGDFRVPEHVAAAVSGAQVVVHLVATSVPATSNVSPRRDVEDTLIPSISLLEACVQSGVERLVFFSSGGAVYGRARSPLIDEDHPTFPLSSYGVSKLAIEKYVELFHDLHGLPCTILRPGNPYGEWQDYRGRFGLVAVALGCSLRGETLTVWGDGSAARDFFYVGDLANACVRVVRLGVDGAFNVAGGRGETINEILDAVRAVTGRPLRVRYEAARRCDPQRSILDVARLRAVTGWEPTVGLEQGVRRTWAWVQAQEAAREGQR